MFPGDKSPVRHLIPGLLAQLDAKKPLWTERGRSFAGCGRPNRADGLGESACGWDPRSLTASSPPASRALRCMSLRGPHARFAPSSAGRHVVVRPPPPPVRPPSGTAWQGRATGRSCWRGSPGAERPQTRLYGSVAEKQPSTQDRTVPPARMPPRTGRVAQETSGKRRCSASRGGATRASSAGCERLGKMRPQLSTLQAKGRDSNGAE